MCGCGWARERERWRVVCACFFDTHAHTHAHAHQTSEITFPIQHRSKHSKGQQDKLCVLARLAVAGVACVLAPVYPAVEKIVACLTCSCTKAHACTKHVKGSLSPPKHTRTRTRAGVPRTAGEESVGTALCLGDAPTMARCVVQDLWARWAGTWYSSKHIKPSMDGHTERRDRGREGEEGGGTHIHKHR